MGFNGEIKKNGRYTQEFVDAVEKCIKKGMNLNDTAEELAVDWYGSGFRQLYFKLKRDVNMAETIPQMQANNKGDYTAHKDDSLKGDKAIDTLGKEPLSSTKQSSSLQKPDEVKKRDVFTSKPVAKIQPNKEEAKTVTEEHKVEESKVEESKVEEATTEKPKKRAGRPKGSKNKPKIPVIKSAKDIKKPETSKPVVEEEVKKEPQIPSACVGRGMNFEAKCELLQQLKDNGYMVSDHKSDVEVSTEFLDNTLEKFKSTLANKEDLVGVDYLLGSIDAKIDSLENEILERQNTISFLRFLSLELKNLSNKEV